LTLVGEQYFDNRRASINSLEPQLKSLYTSLITVTKARMAFASSIQELSAAVAALASCDLSSPARHVLGALAKLQERVKGLVEAEARSEEAGIVATVDSYVRLINSVRVCPVSRDRWWA
jgi:sorting nexin-1/2